MKNIHWSLTVAAVATLCAFVQAAMPPELEARPAQTLASARDTAGCTVARPRSAGSDSPALSAVPPAAPLPPGAAATPPAAHRTRA